MEKTLRDELAMSLEPSLIPTLQDEATIKLVAEKLGLETELSHIAYNGLGMKRGDLKRQPIHKLKT